MVAYQATRGEQARLRALTAVDAVVMRSTTLSTSITARRLPNGAAATRTAATTTLASALFATPTSVG